MSINWEKKITFAGAGGLDEALIYWDEKSGRTGNFKTAEDLGRVAMVVGGLAASALGSGQIARMGENISDAGTTLLVKSRVRVLRHGVGRRTAFPVRYGVAPHAVRESVKPGWEGAKAA